MQKLEQLSPMINNQIISKNNMQVNVTFEQPAHNPLILLLDDRLIPSTTIEDIQHSLNQIINKTLIKEDEITTEEEALLIYHAEQLKIMSIELLSTERKVRELLLLESFVSEQYELRERAYRQRIEECDEVSRQQLELIDHLVELSDHLKKPEKKRHRNSFMTTTTWQSSESSFFDNSTCATSISSHNDFYAHPKPIEHRGDWRYKLCVWIGGSIGGGKLIHSFENKKQVKEFLIAGFGVIQSCRYNYTFHIDQAQRSRFKLLSKSLWTPDDQQDQCQSGTCLTRFSFKTRRHHCRR
ncbi:hypothetical protein G6F61_002676 [Rhizopus arrhizus]|nr:hypothetical protein G6F61_002676 [Rhizopus arrhizus]